MLSLATLHYPWLVSGYMELDESQVAVVAIGDTPDLLKPLLESFQAARTAMQEEMEKAKCWSNKNDSDFLFHFHSMSMFLASV